MDLYTLWVLLDENNIVTEVTSPSLNSPSENHIQLNEFYNSYNLVRVGWKFTRSSILFSFIPSTEEQFEDLKDTLIFLVGEREECETSHQSDQSMIDFIITKSTEIKDNIAQYTFSDENSKQLLFYFQDSIRMIDV